MTRKFNDGQGRKRNYKEELGRTRKNKEGQENKEGLERTRKDK